jgi:transcriptional regulator with XRE-family HTH domain
MPKKATRAYETITGRRIALSKLTKPERKFLAAVGQKYKSAPEWTRFAAWWYGEFARSGLKSDSPAYRICQDLEARLGIDQGKVSPPDYRDYLADLIDTQFGSRQEFCQRTGVDPGQLSRVFGGRADLSIRALQSVLEVLHARLVIQTDDQVRAQTSVAGAEEALVLTAH